MAFTPKKKASVKDSIKKFLLKGNIVRYDFQAPYVEVMDRDFIPHLSTMGNIGEGSSRYGAEKVSISHDTFMEALKELEQEYSVCSVRCAWSGCCQYTTYGVYLE